MPVVARKRGNARGAKGHRNGRSVSERDSEEKAAAVPEWVKQAEEIRGRWPWVERSVWSERMLQALENGVKGGKWFSLIDKVWNLDNLSAAWMKAWANGGSAGVDGQSLRQFTGSLSQQLERLHQELKTGQYQPHPVRRHWIPKPGSTEQRPLGIPTVSSYCTGYIRASGLGMFDSVRVGYPSSKPCFGFRVERDPKRHSRSKLARSEMAVFDPIINHPRTDAKAIGYICNG